MNNRIQKILVANRGEIAVRVIRACKELGIATVAVYSEVDRQSLPVIAADEAVEIGSAPPRQSYLNIDRLIEVAKLYQCDAIHPGYGFLAENAQFARRCQEEGIIFIGPDSEALEKVGNKLIARRTMAEAGVPIIPGMETSSSRIQELKEIAEQIGYPLMIKASAGGGGKGMRIIRGPSELQSAVEAGQREAKSAFGDNTVYLEKYLENPRHIEFQVLADQSGNIIHLFERECSIQRRHQKIVEEAPSPALDDQLRREMDEAACRVMRAVQYQNAGTVEFLLDANKNFYFLEVNARIQVEHPITEIVTGVDLVKQQIRIAAGEPLPYVQEQINLRGHAIECRIYAEDPENNFFPSIGKLLYVCEPEGPGIRCDSGIYSGLEITHHYDPILSKLIVWAENRSLAIQKMRTALSDYIILGVKTSIPFLQDLLKHPKFISGELHTNFIAQFFANWKPEEKALHRDLALVAAAFIQQNLSQNIRSIPNVPKSTSPWQSLGEWQLLGAQSHHEKK